jgi:hypothetical protein
MPGWTALIISFVKNLMACVLQLGMQRHPEQSIDDIAIAMPDVMTLIRGRPSVQETRLLV